VQPVVELNRAVRETVRDLELHRRSVKPTDDHAAALGAEVNRCERAAEVQRVRAARGDRERANSRTASTK
jgi:hypothetical protein